MKQGHREGWLAKARFIIWIDDALIKISKNASSCYIVFPILCTLLPH